MRRRQLELILSRIPPHPKPKLEFEQYTTPATLAATLLWIAQFHYQDLEGKLVLDLGCGTGRLGIGAALLGAEYVVMLDIDAEALEVARDSAHAHGVGHIADFVCADVSRLPFRSGGVFHAVVQNPPFGVHHQGYDVLFVSAACSLARVVYSLHKESTEDFIKSVFDELGFASEVVLREKMCIPYVYSFHRKTMHCFRVIAVRAAARRQTSTF